MSYSVNVHADSRGDLNHKLREAVNAALDAQHYARDEAEDHLEEAFAAVARISKWVGRSQDAVDVSISGHANSEHEPNDEWADEHISISIRVTAKK